MSSHVVEACAAAAVLCWIGCAAPKAPAVSAHAPTPTGDAEMVNKLDHPMLVKDVGFMTPESVLYDAIDDVYLVSNIQGSPLGSDDQAFISRLAPDGSVLSLKWIDSTASDVTLDAPKGMTIVGNVLYVADIDDVRKFDRKTGKPLGAIAIPGSTFLNDIAAAPDGTLYVSDSGLTTGFAPSGTDAVFRISPAGAVAPLLKDVALGRPNGLLPTSDGVWVVTFGSGELYRIDASGARGEIKKLPKGSLDGIVLSGDTLIISSWEASALYAAEGHGFKEIVTGVDAPADIGLDTKRKRVLVPLFNQNAVAIHQL